jgi:hypothetical protein
MLDSFLQDAHTTADDVIITKPNDCQIQLEYVVAKCSIKSENEVILEEIVLIIIPRPKFSKKLSCFCQHSI